MLFNSLAFAAFFPLVFAAAWALHKAPLRLQNLLLLGASYVFYGLWDWRFLALLFGSSVLDYALARLMAERATTERARKRLLWVSLSVNLGALGFFKYFGFFVEQARALLTSLGLDVGTTTLEIILPVGISFYTFQTLSYTLDVYRRVITPTKDLVGFLAFVSFFPQLVAGPIERAEDLLPQFEKRREFNTVRAHDALRQMLWGLVKKVLIADNLAPTVEYAFAHHTELDGISLLAASGLFFVQIYCDFSGYSDMAIGSARLLGFDLTRNFAYPFFSRDFTEFWRRWHISLNTWLRDYVFLPLEVRTRKRHQARRKLDPSLPRTPPVWTTAWHMCFVFTLSGFWHGASWTFILWGTLCGLYLVPELLRRRPSAAGIAAQDRFFPTAGEVGRMLMVNLAITLSLVLFRADSLGHAGSIYAALFTRPLGGAHGFLVQPLLLAAFPIVIEWLQRRRPHGLDLASWPVAARWGAYLALIFALVLHGSVESREFVYFQF
jgi:alginate O-acetyltransferase complex protein AlgI